MIAYEFSFDGIKPTLSQSKRQQKSILSKHAIHGINGMIQVPLHFWSTLFLDEALTAFESQYPEKAQVVKMRYFARMTIQEIAQALEVSTSTVDNYWAFAKAWLRVEMDDS